MFNQSLFDYLKLAVIEVFTSHTLVSIKNQGFVEILIFSFLSQKAEATTHIAFCVFEFI